MVRSMMSFTKLPLSFGDYALETAAKLLNIAPSKTVAKTPYEIWHGKPASYKYLRIYMDQPVGFISIGEEQNVCCLHRSIYGLKQASRSWNNRFDEVIKSCDFVKNEFDPCMYKKVSRSLIVFLVLYVDDILLIGNDAKMLGDKKAWISMQFSMKNLDDASYILGIKIYRDRSRRILGMTQASYIENTQSPKVDEEIRRKCDIPYASTVGNIQYVVQCTRPDIAFALSVT
ncbi:UNVERIFIED_CONTAM: Retrovirus-related Pol polyprotein from transposon RE1, partial [Sesamum radiatum]